VKVGVSLFATLSAYLPDRASGDRADLDLPEGTTVRGVIELLEIPPGLECVSVVNGRDAEPEHPLKDGDVLTLFPPLAGGSCRPVLASEDMKARRAFMSTG
jgi:sulfur-carrier protein